MPLCNLRGQVKPGRRFGQLIAACFAPGPLAVGMAVLNLFASEVCTLGGIVIASGANESGQTEVPPELTNVVAVAGGLRHSLALRADGTVAAWGAGDFGQKRIPIGLTNVTSVAARYNYSLAVRGDGSVTGWGSWASGQVKVPGGLTNVTEVGAGVFHVLALQNDSTVRAWGNNSYNQTNVPAGLSNIIRIAAGEWHNLALTAGGTVVGWGANGYGQAQPPVDLRDVVAISCGAYYSSALKADGTVVLWGANGNGRRDPSFPLKNVIGIAAGGSHSVALKADGRVALWGDFNADPAGVFSAVTNGAAVAAGDSHVLVLLGGGSPVFSRAITNRFIARGTRLNLFAPAVGARPLSYQWQLNGVDLPGETDLRIRVSEAQPEHEGRYTVIARNAEGTAKQEFFVTLEPLLLVTQPLDRTAWLRGMAKFSVGVEGSGLQYQWYFNETNLPGETNSQLIITGVQREHIGKYHVSVTNAYGAAVSREVTLSFTTVAAWGQDLSGETVLQPGLTNVVDIAAGAAHSLVLTRNKTLLGWGNMNGFGDAKPPAFISDIVGISAGGNQDLGLKANGRVVTWGDSYDLQNAVPAPLDHVVAVASGGAHCLALTAEGTVVGWGAHEFGQTDVPSGLGNVIAISAGRNHSLALRSFGTMIGWGENSYGQVDVPPGLSNVIAIAAGDSVSLALRADGTVVEWGLPNASGDTASGLSNIVGISAGGTHKLALTEAGEVVEWDLSHFGPIPPSSPVTGAVSVAAGETHNLALIGDGPPWFRPALTERKAMQGLPFFILAPATGEMPLSYQWQFNDVDLPGQTRVLLELTAPQPAQSGTYTLIASNAWGIAKQNFQVSVQSFITREGDSQSLAWIGGSASLEAPVSGVESQYQWRLNGADLIGQTNAQLVIDRVGWNDSGTYTVFVTNRYGVSTWQDVPLRVSSIVSWGSNLQGEQNVPTAIRGLAAVSAGDRHGLALGKDGTVKAWGANDYGQITVPNGLSNIVAIAAGGHHSLGLGADGRVVGWGYDLYGQASLFPGISNITAIAAGANHTLALTGDGRVSCWGWPLFGLTNVPSTLTNAMAIAAGAYHNLALTSEGTVIAWGSNASGQTNVPRSLSGVIAIAAGGFHSLALKSDRTVVAWGSTNYGQTSMPPGLSDVIAISAGGDHSVALKADGTVSAWGSGFSGQTNIPAGLSHVLQVAAGRDFSLALVDDSAPVDQNAGRLTSTMASPELFAGQSQNTRKLLIAEPGASAIPPIRLAPGTSGRIVCADNPKVSYQLYLPPAFSTNGPPLPLLVTFNPSGGGMVGDFRTVASQLQFIVVGVIEPDNSKYFPDYVDAKYAVSRDLRQRLYYDPTAVYATGLSGGAWVSFDYAKFYRPFLAGVLSMAGWMGYEYGPTDRYLTNLLVARTTGKSDLATNPPKDLEFLHSCGAVVRDWFFAGGHETAPDPVKRECFAWLFDQRIPPGPGDRSDAERKAASWRRAISQGNGEIVLRECVASILTKPRSYEAHHAQLVLDELQSDFSLFREFNVQGLASGDDAVELFFFRAFGAGKLMAKSGNSNVYFSSLKALTGMVDTGGHRHDNLLDLYNRYGFPLEFNSIELHDQTVTLSYTQEAPLLDYEVSTATELPAAAWNPVDIAPRLDEIGNRRIDSQIGSDEQRFFRMGARVPSPIGLPKYATGTKYP